MRFLLAFFVIFCSLVVSVDAQPRRTPVKKPVRTIKGTSDAPPPAKVEEKNLGLVVDKYVSNYELNADGTGTEIREIQQRCTYEACVQRLESFKQIFNGDLQKMRIMQAHVVKADGTKSAVPASAITDRATDQSEAAPGFSSLRELAIKFEGLKVGDAAYVKVETITTKPTFAGQFDSLELFTLLFDWKSIEVNVAAPADFALFIDATGLDGGKLADENGRSRWQYKKLNASALDLEPSMLDVVSVSPRFALTTYRDAEALGSVFWQNAKSKAIVTPEIQALADEITKDATTPAAQAAAIYDWVNRNIRYLSIVLDRGGWVPHSAAEIIRNRYGDCKDYTTLIHTLLKAKGIDSTPVLIRSDLGNWFPSVPTADFFNHLILYIPSLNVFADATTPNTRLGLVPQTLVGKRGVLAGEKTGIIQLPKDNPAENQMLSDATLEFAANGSVKGRLKNTYIGRSEIIFRPLFASSVLKRESETFVKVMLSYYGIDGTGSIVNVGNPHNIGEPFNVELETRVNNFTTFSPKGKLQIPPGMNLMSLAALEVLVSTEARKTSVIIGASTIRETVAVNMPPNVKVVPPQALGVKINNPIGHYAFEPKIIDGGIRFTREIVLKKDVIAPDEYPLLKDLVKLMLASNTIEIEYSADRSLLRAKSKELRSAPAGAPKADLDYQDFPGGLIDRVPARKLTLADIRRMEKKLTVAPDDLDTRLELMRHYDNTVDVSPQKTAEMEAAHLRHRIWLIQNRPDLGDDRIYGFGGAPIFSSDSLDALKNAWLAKVDAQKNAAAIRLNAIDALRTELPEDAMRLAEEGAKLDPSNYQFPLIIVGIESESDVYQPYHADLSEEAAKVIMDHGKRALALLKKERSEERDAERASLLTTLCEAAMTLGDLDGATSFATELVLDFGQSSVEAFYEQAAHLGNTTLGRVELRRKNTSKAKDHLMASIRAPLRAENNSLSSIDTRLAKDLYEQGERAAVVEYLKLCLELGNFKAEPELYDEEIKALKNWQDQIGKGIKPSFDFEKP